MSFRRFRCDRGHTFTDYSNFGTKAACPLCRRADEQAQSQPGYTDPMPSARSASYDSPAPEAAAASDNFSSGGGGDFGGGGSSGDY